MSDETGWKQFVPWGHDITRHTYGSMWEAEHRGEEGCREKVVAHMGHENFKTFKSYYLNARSRTEAMAFWAVRPPKDQHQRNGMADFTPHGHSMSGKAKESRRD